jgi:hypothetical protein
MDRGGVLLDSFYLLYLVYVRQEYSQARPVLFTTRSVLLCHSVFISYSSCSISFWVKVPTELPKLGLPPLSLVLHTQHVGSTARTKTQLSEAAYE